VKLQQARIAVMVGCCDIMIGPDMLVTNTWKLAEGMGGLRTAWVSRWGKKTKTATTSEDRIAKEVVEFIGHFAQRTRRSLEISATLYASLSLDRAEHGLALRYPQ